MLYGSNLTYRTGRVVRSVDAADGQPGGSVTVDIVANGVVMDSETYAASVLNVIPPTSGRIDRADGWPGGQHRLRSGGWPKL